MAASEAVIPAMSHAWTLGGLLGPVATLAVLAIMVALGVVLAGLVAEWREGAARRRHTSLNPARLRPLHPGREVSAAPAAARPPQAA
jgi:hypothetical protein